MKNYDLIYFCGDSWTVAHNTDNVLPEKQPEHTLFTYLVADHFKIPYKVDAKGGASNDWIQHQLYNNLPEIKKEYNNILCVVGYSCPTRKDIYYKKTNQVATLSDNACSKEFYERYITEHFDYEYCDTRTKLIMKTVRSLTSFLSIDLIEAFAFSKILDVDFLYNNHVLEKHYLDISGDEGRIYNPVTGGLGHQNQIGNRKIADALIDKIQSTYGSN